MGGRTIIRQAGVVAAGLALGVGGMAYLDRDSAPSYRPGTPSVTAFSFATTVPDGPPRGPEQVPVLDVEPATAPAAVAAFLQPLADGTPAGAYPLLDEPSRRRYPTLAAWINAQADRAAPRTFTVGTSRPNAERPGAVEVDLSATHTSSLDPIRGLVPARSSSTWLVRLENDAWRVSADPLAFRPVLPDDAAASAAVQGWVSLLAACDTPAAAAFQVTPNLYGPASLARTPCETQGTWTAGEPTGLDRTPDPPRLSGRLRPRGGHVGPAGAGPGARRRLPGCRRPHGRRLAGHGCRRRRLSSITQERGSERLSILKKLRVPALLGVGIMAASLVPSGASSHREAPLISQDPVADNTDVYAFRSPDRPDSVTFVANWIPFEEPAGGPNFFNFGDDVLYQIHVDNNHDAEPDISYEWRFTTRIQNPNTFLYNTGPITAISDADFNFRQFYDVSVVRNGVRTTIGSNLPVPPNNIGPAVHAQL